MNFSFGGNNSGRQSTKGAAIDHIGFEIDNLEDFCLNLNLRVSCLMCLTRIIFTRPEECFFY